MPLSSPLLKQRRSVNVRPSSHRGSEPGSVCSQGSGTGILGQCVGSAPSIHSWEGCTEKAVMVVTYEPSQARVCVASPCLIPSCAALSLD